MMDRWWDYFFFSFFYFFFGVGGDVGKGGMGFGFEKERRMRINKGIIIRGFGEGWNLGRYDAGRGGEGRNRGIEV